MSLTPTGGPEERSFDLVRQSLLQGDGLPFADALTAEQMQQAFDDEGISFGQNDHEATVFSANTEDDDGIVSTPAVMLSQALFTGTQRPCPSQNRRPLP